MESDYLSGWKQIAEYLGRGVRTVQRWEAEFGMPIRRPAGRSRAAVMAHRNDIDQWLSSRTTDRVPVLRQGTAPDSTASQ